MFWKNRIQKLAEEWARVPTDPIAAMMTSGSAGFMDAMNRSQQLEDNWLAAIENDPGYMMILRSEGADITTLRDILKKCMARGVSPAEVAVKLSSKTNLAKAIRTMRTTSEAELSLRILEM